MKKKVAVLGFFGKFNCGDESYKMAFPTIFPDYDFTFVDDLTPAIKDSNDAFILGGGDILAPDLIAKFDDIKKPKHIISATASNPNISAEKLKSFSNIIVRDYQSVALLQEKGLKTTWMPDIACVLRGNPERGAAKIKELFAKEEADCYQKVVCVIVNSYLLQEDHPLPYWAKTVEFLQFANKLANVIDGTSASVIFLPFGGRLPYDDRVSGSWVASRCKFWKKNIIYYQDPSNVQNILDIISASNAVVSTRLHSSIFSVANSIPLIDITHNHKNKWFLETVNMKDYSVDYRNFDSDWCRDHLRWLLIEPTAVKDTMNRISKKHINIVKQVGKISLV